MPADINVPTASESLDRLNLTATAVRGANASIPWPCPCCCFDVESSLALAEVCGCFEVE